jgi:hypothetical protein
MNTADIVSSGASRPLGDAVPLGVFHDFLLQKSVFSLQIELYAHFLAPWLNL